MKHLKKYWAFITLFAIAVLAIAAIFIWPDYKDVCMALIAVSIPTGILSIEMIRSKEQFNASTKLNKIDEIRSQSAKLIEALNQNELVKLQNDFNDECKRVIIGSTFYSKKLLDSIKPIIDKYTIESLKLNLLLPQDESGIILRKDLSKRTKVFENSLLDFQTIICYMSEKTTDQMTYQDFNNYYSNTKNISFDLNQWIDDNKGIGLLQKKDNENERQAIGSIAIFANYILDNPSNRDYSSDIQMLVMQLLSNYCNTKEKEIL